MYRSLFLTVALALLATGSAKAEVLEGIQGRWQSGAFIIEMFEQNGEATGVMNNPFTHLIKVKEHGHGRYHGVMTRINRQTSCVTFLDVKITHIAQDKLQVELRGKDSNCDLSPEYFAKNVYQLMN